MRALVAFWLVCLAGCAHEPAVYAMRYGSREILCEPEQTTVEPWSREEWKITGCGKWVIFKIKCWPTECIPERVGEVRPTTEAR
jgi:hypothetical protein